MSETSPQPDSGFDLEKARIRVVVSDRGLSGCANDLKWGKLLDAMRQREGWVPSFRFKRVDGLASNWDTEWWHHLPFPMMSVEWFDIGYFQEIRNGALTEPDVVDHSDWILKVLNEAKFCYDVIEDVIRVFGYLPKSLVGLDPNYTRPGNE